MPEVPPLPSVMCPNCRTVFPVPEDWRLVQCPSCGHVITRMEEDAAFD